MGRFGNLQAYDFKKRVAQYLEDRYNYFCEFPQDYERIPIKVYSSWVAKYEKDPDRVLAEVVFTFEDLKNMDIYDDKVIRKLCREIVSNIGTHKG